MLCRAVLFLALLQVTYTTADKFCYTSSPYSKTRQHPYTFTTTELKRRWYCLWICKTEERRTHTGYNIETTVDYRTQRRCCNGYKEQYSDCVPICRNDCSNGYCSAPDTCTCYNGYATDVHDSSKCVSKCYPSCTNGKCNSPNTCTCNEGFKKSTSSVCLPICSPQCINGQCSSPNSCSCNTGYTKNLLFWYRCNPNCNPGCINGYCSAPNLCTCKNGYEKEKNYSNKCVPACPHGCINGDCTSPNECTCKPGFTKDFKNSTRCNPDHDPLCVNGKCPLSRSDTGHVEAHLSKYFTTVSLVGFLVAFIIIIIFLIRKFPRFYSNYSQPSKWFNKFHMPEERYFEKT